MTGRAHGAKKNGFGFHCVCDLSVGVTIEGGGGEDGFIRRLSRMTAERGWRFSDVDDVLKSKCISGWCVCARGWRAEGIRVRGGVGLVGGEGVAERQGRVGRGGGRKNEGGIVGGAAWVWGEGGGVCEWRGGRWGKRMGLVSKTIHCGSWHL